MNISTTIRIGCGRGPHEARRFVAMLAQALIDRLRERGAVIEGTRHHGDRDAPGRVVVRLRAHEDTVDELIGTHLLTADLRGNRARRRWFAAVEREDAEHMPTEPLARHDLDIRFVRSRGPGGQNVNKRATAVQLTHRPSGLSVFCDKHRSQARNRADAMASLQESVTRHLHQERARLQRTEAWQGRRELTTNTPIMCWRMAPKSDDAIVPA